MPKSTLLKYVEFVVSRLLGTVVDTAVLWVCAKFLFGNYFGQYILSPAISFEFAVMSNFLCSYYWIWSSRVERKDGRTFWHHFWIFNISSIAGFIVKMVFLLIFQEIFGWNVVICNLVALTISGILNYFLAESLVFRKRYVRPAHELISVEELGEASAIFRGEWGVGLGRLLLKISGMEKLNRFYDKIADLKGAECAAESIRLLRCDYLIGNAERLTHLPEGAFITISNHPYGGLDGIILVDIFSGLREDYKVMVNDILSRIEPMRDVFIGVTPTGDKEHAATATSLSGVRQVVEHLANGHPVGFFPAGAVSDLHVRAHCTISDRKWQNGLIRLIKQAEVPIVPVRFFNRNSRLYYSLGLIDWRVRVLRLPWELFNKHKKQHRIGIGATISVEEQRKFSSTEAFGRFLRSAVYDMPLPNHFFRRADYHGEK